MFDLGRCGWSHTDRSGGTSGWRGRRHPRPGAVIFGSVRSGRPRTVAFAVGGYIAAAYWFTSSTSFANPAVTIGRMFSDTFAGIAPRRCRCSSSCSCSAAPARPDLAVPAPWAPRRSLIRAPMTDKPAVLFVCVHNAGRSQMAAGYLAHLAGGRVEVRSAGSAPADSINPVVGRGDGRGRHRHRRRSSPNPHRRTAVAASDVVITMGCGDACPIYPGKRYEDWELDDPAGQGVDAVRPIRDETSLDEQLEGAVHVLRDLGVAVARPDGLEADECSPRLRPGRPPWRPHRIATSDRDSFAPIDQHNWSWRFPSTAASTSLRCSTRTGSRW